MDGSGVSLRRPPRQLQVNRHFLGTMRKLVSEIAARAAKKSTAIDLYSGVGFFSRPLAALFETVTAVDPARDRLLVDERLLAGRTQELWRHGRGVS